MFEILKGDDSWLRNKGDNVWWNHKGTKESAYGSNVSQNMEHEAFMTVGIDWAARRPYAALTRAGHQQETFLSTNPWLAREHSFYLCIYMCVVSANLHRCVCVCANCVAGVCELRLINKF